MEGHWSDPVEGLLMHCPICACSRMVNEMGVVPSLARSDLPYRQMDKVHLQYQQVVN